jgi:hypothetical protein
MKTYNEILKDIEKTKKALKAAEAAENVLIDKITAAPDWTTRKEIKKELNDAIIKAQEKTQDLKLKIRFLNHNKQIALFNEITPVIIKAIEQFKKKAYGEKTRTAFSDYIKDVTGCRCYISNSYTNSEIKIYIGQYSGDITIGTPEGVKILNNDNRIQQISADGLRLYYINNIYFDDIPAAIKTMKKAYKKAFEKQKELEKICDEFNFYAVDNIEHIYKDKWIYEKFTV